jgi:alkylhydroperoxidase/carboxymuconolactone decarboxylase family protein YurZ
MPVWTEAARSNAAAGKEEFIDRILARQLGRHKAATGKEEGADLSSVGGFYGALMTVDPEIAWHYHDLGRLWRTAERRGTIPNKTREWIDMVIAVELRNTPVLFNHLPDFVAHGGRPEAVDALVNRRPDLLTEEERALALYIKDVIRGEVTDESFRAAKERLGEKAAVELTAFSCYLLFIMRMIDASGESPVTWDQVVERLASLKAGSFKLPSPQARIA